MATGAPKSGPSPRSPFEQANNQIQSDLRRCTPTSAGPVRTMFARRRLKKDCSPRVAMPERVCSPQELARWTDLAALVRGWHRILTDVCCDGLLQPPHRLSSLQYDF